MAPVGLGAIDFAAIGRRGCHGDDGMSHAILFCDGRQFVDSPHDLEAVQHQATFCGIIVQKTHYLPLHAPGKLFHQSDCGISRSKHQDEIAFQFLSSIKPMFLP